MPLRHIQTHTQFPHVDLTHSYFHTTKFNFYSHTRHTIFLYLSHNILQKKNNKN